ncbi:hypothetical protein [Maliponia aquimaris]|uniref:Uncharacterized protein n=1 Tax=Maliponia aquimaris TaxID=1673631 RepID=A0A238L1D9_9RHOB|nr:hypothetical protein [Maliponia aquimaris]SMX48905.1 hypothetical protein MAA8898_04164 [Maliponia aquimaris]
MKLSEVFLYPGTKCCERLGVNPESDAGLIRWMFNTIIYTVVGIVVVWIIVA